MKAQFIFSADKVVRWNLTHMTPNLKDDEPLSISDYKGVWLYKPEPTLTLRQLTFRAKDVADCVRAKFNVPALITLMGGDLPLVGVQWTGVHYIDGGMGAVNPGGWGAWVCHPSSSKEMGGSFGETIFSFSELGERNGVISGIYHPDEESYKGSGANWWLNRQTGKVVHSDGTPWNGNPAESLEFHPKKETVEFAMMTMIQVEREFNLNHLPWVQVATRQYKAPKRVLSATSCLWSRPL